MRIIAGRLKNLILEVPKNGTRPTTDRTKEAIFSHLEAEDILHDDATVLDLFAGSGALGFEALSRGARHVTFVDAASGAISCLRKTISGARKNHSWDPSSMDIRLVKTKAQTFAQKLTVATEPHYSIVFLDPPYAFTDTEFDDLLQQITLSGALTDDCLIISERSSRSADPCAPDGWKTDMVRAYGETTIYYMSRC
ncbi:MAG: 16S rRNA (guanine(966)-N(2))-methyltransferase RsmD [Aeriscardovia sp.]|nr:16S rRNA (guanine(966)-N(2))-methyltransferase RsmD [Aeriscardovia sp.]